MTARLMYIHGKGSIAQVAAKLNLSGFTVSNWAYEEGWPGLRQNMSGESNRKSPWTGATQSTRATKGAGSRE